MRSRHAYILPLVILAAMPLAALVPAAPASAQDELLPQPPAVDDTPMPRLSPEQVARILKEARARRLALEREQVAAELREGVLYDPAAVETAVQKLSAGAVNTWEDNVERICKAFAAVDVAFGKAYDLLQKGKHQEAAEAFKPLISERDSSYAAAARRFCYGEALIGMGKPEDGIDAHIDMIQAMPDRLSFSSQGVLRAAATYQKIHRLYNAMTLYKLWVDSFGVLDSDLAAELSKKAEAIAADYKDPLDTLSKRMKDVEKRLSAIDSGRDTQQKQKDIVTMLDDLIATAQEKSSSSQGQGQGQQGQKPGEGQGEGQGQGQGKGKGPPQGTNKPSSPAMVSALPGGGYLKPQGLSEVRPSDPTDDWGKLPAVERLKLLETFRETMPERYRDMIRDYYERLGAERPVTPAAPARPSGN